MLPFFKKPYPYNPLSKKELLTNFLIGVFVAFFLIVFQPFEISLWETKHKVFKLLGFGLVSFICPLSFKIVLELISKRSEPEKTWQVWKEIMGLLTALLFIAVGNLIYARLIGIVALGIGDFLIAVLVTFLLAIFPLTANIAMKYNRFLALNRKEALHMEEEVKDYQQRSEASPDKDTAVSEMVPGRLSLVSENEKDILTIDPAALLYIESADNYSEVVFLENQNVRKQLIRASLKRLESQISFPFIIRCHRSYIVNLKQVEEIKGNAQGYKIGFRSGPDQTIAVSRNYSKALFGRLESLK